MNTNQMDLYVFIFIIQMQRVWNPSICMHFFMSTMLPQILQGTGMLDLESKNRKVRRLSRLLQAPAHPLQRLAHLHPSPWVSMAMVGCAA